MFFLAMILLGVVTVPIAGGKLRALADIELKWGWALPAAIGLQILIISVLPEKNMAIDAPIHIASYLLAGAFVVANLRTPGLWLIALGALSNLAVIVANGGVMSASASAFRIAGVHVDAKRFSNSVVLPHPKLAFLGDVLAIPHGWPLNTILSVGDIFIAAGAVILVHGVCGSRLVPSWLQAPGLEVVRPASAAGAEAQLQG